MTSSKALSAITMVFVTGAVSAQGIEQACRDLITTGLREYSIETESSSYLNSVFSRHCEQSGQTKSLSSSAGLDLIVKAIPVSLTGAFSSNEEAMRNFCRSYAGHTEARSESEKYNEKIVARAYDSFDQCVQMAQGGVIVKHKVRDLRNFDFFVAPGFSRPVTVRGIQVAPNVVCEGQDPTKDGSPVVRFDLANNVVLSGDKTLNVACTRTGVQKAGGETVFEEATVTLLTNITPNGNYSAFVPKDTKLSEDQATVLAQTMTQLRDDNDALQSKLNAASKSILSGMTVLGGLNGHHNQYMTANVDFVDGDGKKIELPKAPHVVVSAHRNAAQGNLAWAATVMSVSKTGFQVRIRSLVPENEDNNYGWNGSVGLTWIARLSE